MLTWSDPAFAPSSQRIPDGPVSMEGACTSIKVPQPTPKSGAAEL